MADVGSIVQESLRNQYELLRACEEKDAEIERLRAALDRIRKATHDVLAADTARAALEQKT